MATLNLITQGARDDWPFALTCEHESFADTIGDALGNDSSVSDADALRIATRVGVLIEKAPSTFDSTEVESLHSWATGGGATCTWTCPVCGEEHEEDADASDFIDPD